MKSTSTLRGRYAPSPTGELHLGNVRTALAAWWGTRAAGGSFVMRIEDLDPPRVIPGAEQRLLEDLHWLGVDWDEGPGIGGPHAPYRQSERYGVYQEALQALIDAGRLYGCSCSRADLKRLSSAPHGLADEGPVYPGICRDKALANDLSAAPDPRVRQPALRFVTGPETLCFDDLLAGRNCQAVSDCVGDFVLRRADGLYAYQLAVVVDDALMGITQVVRGADLLDSTARQIQLQQALGFATPTYAHVPLVLDGEGKRLAKRDEATSIRALREAGITAERVVGLLAWSLGLYDSPEPVVAAEVVPRFAWSRVTPEPWRCDSQAMAWLRG